MNHALVHVLTCGCNPSKTYATKATFRVHARSIRHGKWEAERTSRDVHVLVGEKEQQIRRLQQRVHELEQQVAQLSQPRRRRRVSQALKKQVACDQDWKCHTCMQKLPSCYEVDHVRALWQGGSNDRENLRALCRNCHGNKTQSEALLLTD
jgi:TolA-binding protein